MGEERNPGHGFPSADATIIVKRTFSRRDKSLIAILNFFSCIILSTFDGVALRKK